jgi:hypothetical protein
MGIEEAHTGFCRKPEGRGLLGRPRRRWENNIKMDLREVRCMTGSLWLWIETGGWVL